MAEHTPHPHKSVIDEVIGDLLHAKEKLDKIPDAHRVEAVHNASGKLLAAVELLRQADRDHTINERANEDERVRQIALSKGMK